MPPASPATPLPSNAVRGTAYALLADNRLLAIRARDGSVLAEQRLAPMPTTPRSAGHRLALNEDATRLFALAVGDPGWADVVVVVDLATAAVLARYPLAESGDVFRGLAVGPRTGRLYLFGVGPGSSNLRVAVLDAETGRALATWIGGVGNDELLQGAVSPDEQRLLVAYHQSGIRQYEVTADGLRQCQLASPRRCLAAHGDFALYGDRVLTGGDDGAPIVEYGPDDRVRRILPMGLEGNHMVALAVDPAGQRLYVLGGCGYTHGLSAVSLRDTPAPEPPTVLFPSTRFGEPGDRSAVPCGARLAVGPAPLVVVGRLGLEIPEARAFGALLFLDAQEGRIVRTVPTPSEPVDVLVSPGP